MAGEQRGPDRPRRQDRLDGQADRRGLREGPDPAQGRRRAAADRHVRPTSAGQPRSCGRRRRRKRDSLGSGMTSTPDMKPRSATSPTGSRRPPPAACCAPSAWATTTSPSRRSASRRRWNEITPCNLSLDRLAKPAKNGVHAAGGYPLEFGTISVSDGISMGHEGMRFSLVSREVIADSVETVMIAERLDGSVLLAGCDKSLPGHADGRRPARPRQRLPLRRLDHARPGRRPRRHDHRRLRGGRCLPGRQDHPRRARPDREAPSARARAPAAACTPPTRWPASARRSACRLPGTAAPPAVDRRRDGFAHRSGEAVVEHAAPGHHRAPDHDQARRSRTRSPS